MRGWLAGVGVVLWVSPLAACGGGDSEAVWARGFGLRWVIANHRLSQVAIQPHGAGVRAAFVGGASTTGCVFSEGYGCVDAIPPEDTCLDVSSCAEFVLLDQTLVAVDRVRARARGPVVLGEGSVDLIVRPEGSSAQALVELPHRGQGEVSAWIRGWSLSSDVPRSADAASCYDPRHGWLPDHLSISVGTPEAVSRTSVLVPVSASFGSGESFEAVRECLDAVRDEMSVAMRVELVVAVGGGPQVVSVSNEAVWSRREPQPLADVGDRSVPVGPAVGWSSLSWRFHEVEDPGRGAYLRSLAAWVDPAAGEAWGLATNDSPTQLSGFDFRFDGDLVMLEELEVVDEGVWGLDAMPTTLDEQGRAVLHELEAPVQVPSFTQ